MQQLEFIYKKKNQYRVILFNGVMDIECLRDTFIQYESKCAQVYGTPIE